MIVTSPWTEPYHIPIPVRRCPGAADHQDPVMTSYLCLLPRSNLGLGVEGQRWSSAVFGVADENATVLRVVADPANVAIEILPGLSGADRFDNAAHGRVRLGRIAGSFIS
jgi:hypothetical protein